jgi:LsmAD domain/Ataxin 2 SM domain
VFYFLMLRYKGHTVIATVKGGARFSGILATAPADNGELSVAIHLARALDVPPGTSSEPKLALLILAKDLVELSAEDVDLDARTAQPSAAEVWKTDADISGAATPSGNRPLQKWEAAPHEVSAAAGLEDDARPSARVWDQFSVNERLFGAKSDYEEEFYTTKIDRTAKDYKERERRAMQIAQEILSVSVTL